MLLKSWEELSPEEKLYHHERMENWAVGQRKTPLERKKYSIKNIGDRFFSNIKKTGGCWLWTGCKNRLGYGDFWVGRGKHMNAPRVSWMFHYGEILDNMDVLHRCDNPPCVNPEHLFLGTQEDNMRDCFLKGRLFPKKYVGIIDEFSHLPSDKKKRMRRFRDGLCVRCGKKKQNNRVGKRECMGCVRKRCAYNKRKRVNNCQNK